MATNDKYDRQLRLWGPDGQRLLMKSNILLIHANAVGCETLKNLVLPGIKSFTILDDFCVDDGDLGCNFFVTPETKGKPRAEVAANLLNEMNPDDVRAEARVANFRNVLQTEPQYFCKFDLIIASNIPQSHLMPLADLAWTGNIPLLVIRSYGLIGSIRLQLHHHEVYDSREERDMYDLRLAQPFPELVQFLESFDLTSLDSMEHAHVPFPAILWQAKLQWAAKNGKDAPSSFAEKEQFKAVVKSLARDYGRELNFEQAVKESYRAYTPSQLTPSLETLLSSDISGDVNGSSPFSVMLGALRRFVQANDGLLPLSGSIPDMVATTDSFIHLQQIYQRKALEDFKAFSSMLMDELAARGLPANSIGESEAKEFCRRAASIASIGTRSIAEEMTNDEDHSAKLQEILLDEAYSDPAQTPLVWAMCLRAADIFHSRYARFPGQLDGNLENDTEQLYSILLEQWKKWGLPTELIAPPVEDAAMEMEGVNYAVSVAHAVEVVRFAAMEVHNISAIIGGIASQEAAKILTHQYLPIDNTYIFNGIAGCGSSYQL